MGECAAILEIGAVGSKKIWHDARNETELETAVGNVVQYCDIFRNAERIVERHHISHRADAHAFGPRGRRCAVDRRRRHPAFVGIEVMLDAKSEIKPGFIRERQLAPQLFIARGWSHAWLVPDMRKMRELHRAISSLP